MWRNTGQERLRLFKLPSRTGLASVLVACHGYSPRWGRRLCHFRTQLAVAPLGPGGLCSPAGRVRLPDSESESPTARVRVPEDGKLACDSRMANWPATLSSQGPARVSLADSDSLPVPVPGWGRWATECGQRRVTVGQCDGHSEGPGRAPPRPPRRPVCTPAHRECQGTTSSILPPFVTPSQAGGPT